MTNGLSNPYHLDESTFIFRGIWSVFFIFISHFVENHKSKRNSPRWEATFLGPFCSPMYNKNDTRLYGIISNVYEPVHRMSVLTCAFPCNHCPIVPHVSEFVLIADL